MESQSNLPRVAQRAGGTAPAPLPSPGLGCAPSLHGHGQGNRNWLLFPGISYRITHGTSSALVPASKASLLRAPSPRERGGGSPKLPGWLPGDAPRDGPARGQSRGEMRDLTPPRASSDPGTVQPGQPCCGRHRGTARGPSLIWFSSVLITSLLPPAPLPLHRQL